MTLPPAPSLKAATTNVVTIMSTKNTSQKVLNAVSQYDVLLQKVLNAVSHRLSPVPPYRGLSARSLYSAPPSPPPLCSTAKHRSKAARNISSSNFFARLSSDFATKSKSFSTKPNIFNTKPNMFTTKINIFNTKSNIFTIKYIILPPFSECRRAAPQCSHPFSQASPSS